VVRHPPPLLRRHHRVGPEGPNRPQGVRGIRKKGSRREGNTAHEFNG